MSRAALIPLSILLLALAAPAFAEEEITITASRRDAPLETSTAAVSVLQAGDLERRQIVFARDALATVPGVVVNGAGPFGGVSSVRIRGASSEQTLVLVDGVVLNDPAGPGGGYNAAFLDTNDVAQIEVLRGPQSVLWGSDAIGGVVNIVTRRPGDGVSGAAQFEGDSFGLARAAGSFGFGGERVDLRLGGAAIGTDGISKAERRDGNSEKDDYDNITVDGRAGLAVTDSLRLEAFGRVSDSETEFDSFGFPTGVTDGDEVERTEESMGGALARHTSFEGRLVNQASFAESKIERRYFTDGAESFAIEGKRTAARYQGVARPAQTLTVSFGVEHERTSLKDTGSTTTEGAFLLADYAPAPSLRFTAGVRRDDHSAFGDVVTGQAGMRWQALENAGLRASWGQGFKAPTVFQLSFFFPPATGPNRALQPEEAEGWDIAAFAALFDKRLSAELGYFELDTENLISFAGGRYLNIAQARTRGVEASADWRVSGALSFSGAYTWTDAEDASTDAPLLLAPEHTAFAEVDWQVTPALGVTASLRYTGEKKDTVRPANPAGIVPDWTRVDVAARYRLGARAELFGRVENLTDESYQEVFGYGTSPRAVFAGVKVRFE